MKLTLGMMNCAAKSGMTGVALYLRYGIPGTTRISKHKSKKNGTGHVGPTRSIVLITIHTKSTTLYPIKLVPCSHPIQSLHNAQRGGEGWRVSSSRRIYCNLVYTSVIRTIVVKTTSSTLYARNAKVSPYHFPRRPQACPQARAATSS